MILLNTGENFKIVAPISLASLVGKVNGFNSYFYRTLSSRIVGKETPKNSSKYKNSIWYDTGKHRYWL